jgi:predicted nucleic acid-binding protein
MVSAVFDTNILIDYLNGIPDARDELDRYADKAISVVTWMEVMVGTSPATEQATRDFLRGFALIELDDDVAEDSVTLRKAHRIKLPDAIVWASARRRSALLVTRNSKDFPMGDPGIRMPYSV